MTAEELFQTLSKLKDEYGTLDIPISLFSYNDEDRHQVDFIDIFYDNNESELHSIDLNFF